MKKLITILILVIGIIPTIKSQVVNRTINGTVDKSQSATKIIFQGVNINLKGGTIDKPITITCDVLQINSDVLNIQIHGYVKLICKQYINNNVPQGTSITILYASNSHGILFIEKPSNPSISNIIFDNQCQDLEIQRMEEGNQ